MKRGIRLWTALLLVWSGQASLAAEVPAPLAEWREWALRGQEFRDCPFIATRDPINSSAYVCAWPGPLTLDLSATGGRFSQRWQVHAEGWVRLPGSAEQWPRDLRLNGASAAVVLRQGSPQLHLDPGTHEASGRFEWNIRPEQLPVAPQTAIVQLTLDGRVVAQPERPGGAVWLGQRRSAVEREQLDVFVYRLLRDDIPAKLTTRLVLVVSGAGREVQLGPVLPAGFVPLALEGDLPARLENNGQLRVQLRPGRHELTLEARGEAIAANIARPEAASPWPATEVWSFQGVDRLRVATAEGAESIDPAQANVPGDWSELPAFLLPAGAGLDVVERSRALANPDDNQLRLRRELWLDFDHGGYTLTDEINGRLNRDWRLDMAPPYVLESAHIDEQNLLITAGDGDSSGVELRDRDLALSSIARIGNPRGSLPSTGWSTRFDGAGGTLHLPPGHRLLGAPGADYARGSWMDHWGLWNLFGVLVVIVFARWVGGMVVAVLATLSLVLLYQESPQMIWLWANAIAAIAILRAVPEGRLRQWAARYRIASFAVLVLALLPLLIGQLRLAIYPQLDVSAPSPYGFAAAIAPPMAIKADVIQEAPVGAVAQGRVQAELPPPAPPAPSMELDSLNLQEVQVTGTRVQYANVSNRYATGTLLQAGPGVPDWWFNNYDYGWSGPVEPGQSVRFVWLGPLGMGLWRVVGVLASVLFALLLARATFNFPLHFTFLPGSLRKVLERGSVAGIVAAALLFAPVDAPRAQGFPTAEMLAELRTRLTEPPPCRGSCAEITSASIRANGDRLEVDLTVSALANVAVALPQAGDRWQLERVEVDGRAAPFALREGDGTAWLAVSTGSHNLRLAGRLANAETVQLGFPQPPRAVSVSTNGWDASGLANGRLLSGSLDLIRRRAAGTAAAELAPSEFAPFVRLTRTFNLDLDWSILNRVERIAPRAAPLQVELPLLEGESVLTAGAQIEGDRITAALARGEYQYSWNSALARSQNISLSVPADVARVESWVFAVGPEWHVDFAGFPPSLPEFDGGQWVFHFLPRGGETLEVTITRPAPAAGGTLAIDSVRHSSEFGKRSVTGSLELSYRSTQGGRHTIVLPADLRVTQVLVDGQSVPVRPEAGQLPLSLLVGEHQVSINWTAPHGASWLTRPDAIDVGGPAGNVTTSFTLPADRWPLIARGSGVGTTILYWGELVIFALVAFGLSRWRRSPLGFLQWLLLGLGLSTLSWPVFATVAAWLLVMRWREGWDHAPVKTWIFHGVQVLLAGFTVVAVVSLVFSGVRYGLLENPDMSLNVPGGSFLSLPGYDANYPGGDSTFRWFLDRSDSALPVPAVISVPMWVYRSLMFAWALWIAVSLRHWLPGAWRAWISGGFWRGRIAASA